jgi:hypothetical protein
MSEKVTLTPEQAAGLPTGVQWELVRLVTGSVGALDAVNFGAGRAFPLYWSLVRKCWCSVEPDLPPSMAVWDAIDELRATEARR